MANGILQKFRNVGRLTHIVNVFARYGFKREIQQSELSELITSYPEPSTPSEMTGIIRAQKLCMVFEELGPTFVKLAQFLASQEDILPKHYIDEFKRLQDRVKPEPWFEIKKILEEELDEKTLAQIVSFDEKPIGAASIGQVHLATLVSGQEVVFKIQRPDIEALIQNDLSIFMGIAGILEATLPDLKLLRPRLLVKDLERSLRNELDYLKEAANTIKMRAFFAESETVYVPEVFQEFCTRRILCLEAVNGIKITDLPKTQNNSVIVRSGVQAFLDMTFRFGIFHADLHPGNFILREDDGKLAILDFGMVARLPQEMRVTMTYMILALSRQDMEGVARLFVDMTEPEGQVNLNVLIKDITAALDESVGLSLKELQMGKMLLRLARIAAAANCFVSRELTLFFKALVALENFGRTLDPNFQIIEFSLEYAEEISLTNFNKEWFEKNSLYVLRDTEYVLKEFPGIAKNFIQHLKNHPIPFSGKNEQLENLTKEIDRASSRLSLSIFLGALVLGSSIATFQKQGDVFEYVATVGIIGFAVAVVIGLWLIVSIIRSGRFK